MKTLSHLQNEAIARFEKEFEAIWFVSSGLNSRTCTAFIPYGNSKQEEKILENTNATKEMVRKLLKTELTNIVKESFKNTRVEELNETGINIRDGETVTIPLNIGYNSALSELKDIQNQFLNN